MIKCVVVITVLAASAAFGFVIEPKANSQNSRIVGGSYAAEGQFPWQVSLRNFGSHFCGGSIINSKWILTAAHCFERFGLTGLTVTVGSTTLDSGGTTHSVSRMIIHEDYDASITINDITLLELASEIEYSDNVQPIELETNEVVDVDLDCVLSGWGLNEYNGSRPNNLKYMTLKTLSRFDCESRWSAGDIIENQLCTLPAVEGEGVCIGDSGGPLVYNGKQVGVFSLGSPCANGLPEIFVRVSSMLDWIRSNIGN